MAVRRLSPLQLAFIWLAALGAWVSAGALSVASAQASAPRIGLLPSVLWLLAAVVIATILASAIRAECTALLAIAGVLLLPWLPIHAPAALYIWAGHLRAWMWMLIATAVAAAYVRAHAPRVLASVVRDPRRAPKVAAIAASLLFLTGAYQVFPQLPAGDEPHYLVIAESLLTDHDLKVENNYRRGDYHAYFRDNLRPDYLRRGQNGEIYSIHAPGLPALIAPIFALFGYPGVLALLAIVSGCATGLAWIAAWRVTDDVAAAWFGWAGTALSMPFFFQSFVVYPEAPAAAVVIVAVLTLLDGADASVSRLAWTGVALALLPWMHLRLALLAGAFGLVIAVRQLDASQWPRRVAALLAVPAISAVCWLVFFYVIYGTPDPRAPYGGSQQAALANLPRGLIGLAFDQQFGMLPNAPVSICAVLGFAALIRMRRRLAIELLIVALPYTLSVAAFGMWWGGTSSAARFLTPLMLTLAIPAAAWFHGSRGRASRVFGLGALGVSVLITATIATVDRGILLYNVHDGMSRLLLWISPVADLTSGMPSLFRSAPHVALAQAIVWLAAAAATALVGRALAGKRVGWAAQAAGLALAGAACGMAALTIVWRSERARPLKPTAGNIALLQALDRMGMSTAVQFAPFERLSLADVPPRLVLAEFPLPGAATVVSAEDPLLQVAHAPAATYAIDVTLQRAGAGVLTVGVDRRFGPTWRWDLAGARGSFSREFHTPLPASEMVVDGDAPARSAIARVALRAVAPLPAAQRAANREPWHIVRYGPALVSLMDGGRAYAETSGTWVGGEAFLDMVVTPDDPHRPIHLFVRNPPIDNRITIDAGSWRTSSAFAPGEERTFEIPLSADRPSLPLRITSARGARPVEFERGSTDARFLGCWIEIR